MRERGEPDNGPLRGWVAGSSYRLLAVDARDLNVSGEVSGEHFVLAGGGRYDLEVTVPEAGAAAVVLGSPDTMSVLGAGEPAIWTGRTPSSTSCRTVNRP